MQESLLPDTHDAPTAGTGHDSVFRRNVLRACLTGAMVIIDYSLMLIAMTFNVGLFLAVVASFMLGQLLFGHIGHRDVYEPKALQIWHSALISVKGMTCESCVSTVQRALLALPVVRVQVNRLGERAVVTFDSNCVSADELVAAVNDVGFEATLQLESAEHPDAVLQDVVEGTSSCHP
jgi:copper chaperone CopZ